MNYQQSLSAGRLVRLKHLASKGFGNPPKRQPPEPNSKDISNNNYDKESKRKDDVLMDVIEAKEAEFQAELDKMLAEARDARGGATPPIAEDPFKGFSNEELAKAIVEMQRLKNNSPLPEEKNNFEDGTTGTAVKYRIVKLVVPKGLKGGDALVVEVKQGAFFEIEVPEGSCEGDEIEVELPNI